MENSTGREKQKNLTKEKLGEEYKIRFPTSLYPNILITGISFEYDDTRLLELIKKQNQCMNNTNVKIIKQYEIRKNNKICYNATAEVEPNGFANILAAEKINIGWERCKVYDEIRVLRCFRCKGFNHKAANCKIDKVCVKCHGQHRNSECNERQLNKCINCIRANGELNLGLNEDYHTMSKSCPSYLSRFEVKKNRIGY